MLRQDSTLLRQGTSWRDRTGHHHGYVSPTAGCVRGRADIQSRLRRRQTMPRTTPDIECVAQVDPHGLGVIVMEIVVPYTDCSISAQGRKTPNGQAHTPPVTVIWSCQAVKPIGSDEFSPRRSGRVQRLVRPRFFRVLCHPPVGTNGSRRTRRRPSCTVTTAPCSNSWLTWARTVSSNAVSAAARNPSMRMRMTEGAVAPDNANKV